MKEPIQVDVFWDVEATVWVASSDDMPGLNTYGATREDLYRKLSVMIPELLEEGCKESHGQRRRISYEVHDIVAA